MSVTQASVDAVTAAANQVGISPTVAVAILATERTPNDVTSYAGALGIMQVEPKTAAATPAGMQYLAANGNNIDALADEMQNNPSFSATVGCQYIQQLQQQLGTSDPDHIAAAYNGGPGVHLDANGNWVTPKGTSVQDYVDSFDSNGGTAASNAAASGNTGSPASDPTAAPLLSATPPPAVPIQGQIFTAQQMSALLAPGVINPTLVVPTGLDEVPWYNDPSILQVNGNTAAAGSPVTFKLYYDPNNTFGTNGAPLCTQGFKGTPITVRLNASIQTHEREMKHVANRTLTRTAMLVTLWGMSPDMIVGQGSTGLFMNRMGVTDFLSMSTLTNEAKQLLQQGFGHLSVDGNVMTLSETDAIPQVFNTNGALRVAAKDAFVELLSVFRNNAIVWYQRNQGATGIPNNEQGLAPMTWSPTAGTSTYQMGRRNNDVLTRGKVAMSFRNAIYYGYFKSFSFTMDASSPFRWNFNFAFQVEQTVMQIQIPTAASQASASPSNLSVPTTNLATASIPLQSLATMPLTSFSAGGNS